MILRSAFNALSRIHSRQGQLKRLGTIDIFSPCRLMPSNYFRFLRGPEYTTIKGVEYVIPLDSLTGQFSQLLAFERIPDAGTFKIKFDSNTTTDLQFDCSAVDIQTALRLFVPLANVVVTGSFNTGFTILFVGFSVYPALGQVIDNTLLESALPVATTFIQTSTQWSDPIKKGDRILDGTKTLTVDEVIDLHDIGAIVMGYRIRCD